MELPYFVAIVIVLFIVVLGFNWLMSIYKKRSRSPTATCNCGGGLRHQHHSALDLLASKNVDPLNDLDQFTRAPHLAKKPGLGGGIWSALYESKPSHGSSLSDLSVHDNGASLSRLTVTKKSNVETPQMIDSHSMKFFRGD
jgi:hypothetical protein